MQKRAEADADKRADAEGGRTVRAAKRGATSDAGDAAGGTPDEAARKTPRKILAIDIGGSKLKLLATGEHEPRKIPSGKKMTPLVMVEAVREHTADWAFDAISMGYPGLVGASGPRSEPLNLGEGWVGFDFAAAFGLPVKIINDACMQALGSYDGGRMLFLGFGTGLGSALITDNVVVPLELGRLRHGDETLGERVGRRGLERIGKGAWRETVNQMVAALGSAFLVDYVVLGGGNARVVKTLPSGARLGHNLTAFRGGFRLWNVEDVQTLSPDADAPEPRRVTREWRVV
jgi:hypothetical protein